MKASTEFQGGEENAGRRADSDVLGSNFHRIEPFKPAWWAPGGHLQTIMGYYLGRPQPLSAERVHTITLPDDDRITMLENQPEAGARAVVVLMHGLGSDAEAPYIVRIARALLGQGLVVMRLNHRGAGAGRGLAKWLYHSGRSEDVSAALMSTASIFPDLPLLAVGFSLSGNMLLKLLGEQAQPIPASLRAALAVNPPIELARCAQALQRPGNKIYALRFVLMLKRAMRERLIDFPDLGPLPLDRIRTLRQFDEHITAPLSGFESAEDYYRRCQAKPFLGGVSHPTCILVSEDDPFIPVAIFRDVPQSPYLRLQITRSGGHVGYVHAKRTPIGRRHWLDYAICRWAGG